LPMYDGELGVAPGRAPLIGRLGYGELRVRKGPRVSRYYVDGGFVQVRADVVSVLTPRGVEADKIDVAAATHALQEALRPAATPEGQEAQMKNQQRARAQLHIAGRSGGQG